MSDHDRENAEPDDPQPSAYSARDDDHLVEPMFAGLGVGDDDTTEAEARGFFARLVQVLFRRRSG